MVEDSVLELVDPFWCQEGGLVLCDVLVGGAPVVRAAHPPRVEVSTYQEDEETREVASSRGEKKPKHTDMFLEGW